MTHGFGTHFHSVGRCFMYLRWIESRLHEFLCLKEGKHPRECVEYILHQQASGITFGKTIEKFLQEWPQEERIRHAFKIVEIHRNSFSHAYMPGSGDYLLFAPSNRTKKLIEETGLVADELKAAKAADSPFVLRLPCLHEPFLISFYENLKRIDYGCFMEVARDLGIKNYPGLLADPDWPLTEGVDPGTLKPV